MNDSKDDWVTATEVATFAFCPEAWRLEHALDFEPQNLAVRKKGIARHEKWQRVEKRSGSFVRVAGILFALAVLFWIFRAVVMSMP